MYFPINVHYKRGKIEKNLEKRYYYCLKFVQTMFFTRNLVLIFQNMFSPIMINEEYFKCNWISTKTYNLSICIFHIFRVFPIIIKTTWKIEKWFLVTATGFKVWKKGHSSFFKLKQNLQLKIKKNLNHYTFFWRLVNYNELGKKNVFPKIPTR